MCVCGGGGGGLQLNGSCTNYWMSQESKIIETMS